MNEPTRPSHFHAGSNDPGYLPDSEPACFPTFREAAEYMIAELRSDAESVASWADPHDCDDIPCPSYGDDCPEGKAADLTHLAEELNLESGPAWDSVTAGRSYWITPADPGDCEEYDPNHEHRWEPLERSHFAGTLHRKCQVEDCRVVNAYDDDDAPDAEPPTSTPDLAELERTALARTPWPKTPSMTRADFAYLARILAELEFLADDGRRGGGTVHQYVVEHFAYHLADCNPAFDRDRFLAAVGSPA